MAKFSLSRHDTQARLSVVLSALALVGLVGVVILIFSGHIDYQEKVITYGRNRGLAIQAATAGTLLLGAIGFVMGLSSAGQRRNDKQTLSWIGFFLGATVICLVIVAFFFFRLRGEQWGT